MNLIDYIQKGGVIVYILLILNFLGYIIIIYKGLILIKKTKLEHQIGNKLKKNAYKNTDDAIDYEVSKLESGLNIIKNIATISPLLGLLGTVVGILESFESISTHGLGNPAVFSAGVSVALITTVAGLIVAIPHYLFYNYYISILNNLEITLKNTLSNDL